MFNRIKVKDNFSLTGNFGMMSHGSLAYDLDVINILISSNFFDNNWIEHPTLIT